MEYKSMAQMGHSPNEMESVKQEKKDLMNDNPVARDASGGRPMILKHMGGSKIGGSPLKKHDGKKFEDEGFMDSHFKSGKPRK
jgi:hypothetical protein